MQIATENVELKLSSRRVKKTEETKAISQIKLRNDMKERSQSVAPPTSAVATDSNDDLWGT